MGIRRRRRTSQSERPSRRGVGKGYKINSVYAREQDESEALSSLVWALGACKGMMQSRSGAVQLKATIHHCRTRQGRNSLIHRYTLFLPCALPSSLSLRPSIHSTVSPINCIFLFISPFPSPFIERPGSRSSVPLVHPLTLGRRSS